MASVTVSISDNLKHRMDAQQTVNWSAVARKSFEDQVEKLELIESIVSKSKATEKDVEELSQKIKEGMRKRHEGTK